MNFRSKLEQKCYIVSKRLLYLGPFPARRHFQSAGDGIPLYRPLLRVCASTGEVNGTMVPAGFADKLFNARYLKALYRSYPRAAHRDSHRTELSTSPVSSDPIRVGASPA